jgi:GTP pyrophosphokinase
MVKAKQKPISKKDSERIEKAIHFLCDKYRESGLNDKPVVLHSLQVACELLRGGASADAAIIAILHDLIEDSGVNFEDIEKNFGSKIASAVLGLTEDKQIKKYADRYRENFGRIVKEGEDAVLVRMVDMFNNSFYINRINDGKKEKLVVNKIGDFLELVRDTKYVRFYEALKGRHQEEQARLSRKKKKKVIRIEI